MLGLILVLVNLMLFNSVNQSAKFYALLIFFFFISNGFQVIPAPVIAIGMPGISKTYDFALIILFATFLFNFQDTVTQFQNVRFITSIKLLILFSIACGVYSSIILNYDTQQIIRVIRPYLLLFSFAYFGFFEVDVLERVFIFLVKLTFVLSIAYLVQIPLHLTTLQTFGGEMNITTLEGTNWSRYYNTPVFLTISFLYCIFSNNIIQGRARWIFLLIFIVTVIAPAHRSYLTVTFGCVLFYLFTKTGYDQKILIIFSSFFSLLALSTLDVVNKVVDKTTKDLSFLSSPSYKNLDMMNTFSFRFLHFLERATFIIEDSSRWIFGLGFITETSPQGQRLNFNVGLEDKASIGKIIQIDTGDIVWSILVIQGGVLCILLNLWVCYSLINFFRKYRWVDYSETAMVSVIIAVMTSFFGTELIGNAFRVITLFLFVLVYKTVQRKKIEVYEQEYTHTMVDAD